MSEVLLPKYRRPANLWRIVSLSFPGFALILVLISSFHWTPFGINLLDTTFLYLLIACFLPLNYLWIPINSKAPRDHIPWYDVVLVSLALIPPLYFVINQWEVLNLAWSMGAPPVPLALSFLLWLLMLEAGRRAAGPVFAIVVGFFSFFPLFAHYMPGILWAPPYTFKHLASFHALSEESILGIPLHVFGRLFFGYMLFAIVLQMLGAGKFFNDIAISLVGKTRAGNAKVAIIASGLFGSISGAPVANVMTTGAFTIPAMKKEGIPAHFAAAVEAVASTGGALMPPVMGAVAFIMAEFLAIPYALVAIAAIVPSILYYWCLFCQIDAFAARMKIAPSPITREIPGVLSTLWNNIHILASFAILIFLLFFFRLSAQGPWYATLGALVLAMFRKETRLTFRGVLQLMEDTGRTLGELMGIMGTVGMIIGSFIIAGIAFTLPHEIVALAGGNVILMLLFGAIAAFILGMGVTVSAVYIFLAIVLAPGLVDAGFNLMAVHMFVLYTAMISYITPPVALCAFAGAAIAGADPMKVGVQAMKLGGAIYILPFVFVANPALILNGPLIEIIRVVPTAFVGFAAISAALMGYFWLLGSLTYTARALFFAAGILMVFPTPGTDIIGIGLLVFLFVVFYVLKSRKNLLSRLVFIT